MANNMYRIRVDGNVVADNMELEYAMVLVKGLFVEFFNDNKMIVSIEKAE